MRLVKAVDGSVLWVLENDPESTVNLRREAEKHGVKGERIIGAPSVAMARHLARYRFVDLFLDSFPVCGHTTTSDALWCGVPVVTMPGDSFITRVAASLLHAVELPQLVVDGFDAYEAKALEIAQSPEKLAGLKHHLDEGRMRFPLFDSAATTRALEAAYRRAADLQREGRAPEAFRLSPDLKAI
jgi:predicted O-linked N-acetylglucosamine transferase (SPINDLY family)